MDHALYPFLPTPHRAKIRWPQQAHLAACVVLHIEEWELDREQGTHRDPRFNDPAGFFAPDYRMWSWREYGNRVGVFRILDLLGALRLPFTVALNAQICERKPALVTGLQQLGCEFAGHGLVATRMISADMTEAAERSEIEAALATIERATGVRPVGWVGQDYGESRRTPSLLVEAGLTYVADWPNDDQPYLMAGGLVSLPNQAEWDDVQLLWHRRVALSLYPKLVREAFRVLWEEGAHSGRFFALHIHPWVLGAPHRFQALVTTLTALSATPQVWWTTLAAVAAEVRAHSAAFGAAVPGEGS
jgi:peptidoglycan/xylan/chitin deacetylase (PgdA/CDA1 family)